MMYEHVLPFTGDHTCIELLAVTKQNINTTTRIIQSFVKSVQEMFAKRHRNVLVNMINGGGIQIGKELVKYAQQHEPDLIVIISALDMISQPFFIGPHA